MSNIFFGYTPTIYEYGCSTRIGDIVRELAEAGIQGKSGLLLVENMISVIPSSIGYLKRAFQKFLN